MRDAASTTRGLFSRMRLDLASRPSALENDRRRCGAVRENDAPKKKGEIFDISMIVVLVHVVNDELDRGRAFTRDQ